MLKTKKSKFIVFTILTIVVLLCLNPLIGVMDYIFGFKVIKNQTFNGDVDVTATVSVELRSGIFFPVSYSYYVVFDFTYNASVTAVEIERINCLIYKNTGIIYSYNGNYGSNVIFYSNIKLLFRDNLTCQGSVDLNYQLNNNPQNGTVNYNLVYTHSIRERDAQDFMLFETIIIIAYILSFFLLPIILFFIIHPDFHEPSKEEKEKNEEYLDYLAKRKQKNEKESSTKN